MITLRLRLLQEVNLNGPEKIRETQESKDQLKTAGVLQPVGLDQKIMT